MTQIREEVGFTKGRIIVRGKLVTRGKAKRADYVLYLQAQHSDRPDRGEGQQSQRRRRDAAGARLCRDARHPLCVFLQRRRLCLPRPHRPERDERNHARPRRLSIARRSVGALSRLEGPDAEAEQIVLQDYFDDGSGKGAALLPAQCHQCRGGSHRQGPEPHPARDGHRHRQDLHGLSRSSGGLWKAGPQETHPVSGRPQRARRPDDGQRFPPLRRGDGEAQHRREDHRAPGRHRGRTDDRARQETPHRHRLTKSTSACIRPSPARRSGRSSSGSSRPASST